MPAPGDSKAVRGDRFGQRTTCGGDKRDMRTTVNLFDLDSPYLEVAPLDYQRLLDACDPEMLEEKRGAIFPQASPDSDSKPKLPEDFDFDNAFSR